MPSDEEVRESIKTSVKLPRSLWKKARIQAIEEDLDLQDILVRALEEYLAKRGGT